ncbi:MAG: helix-turn-helix domain-containing protein [Holosporales bacterium]|nr:helix-turn-helix domain-containing protein [Holosporales bacterium]
MVKYTQSASEIIGSKIKIRRKTLKITQKQLADLIGVTFQQVQKYESGKNRIGLSTFIKICYSLRINPNYFFDTFVFNDETVNIDTNLEQKLLAVFRSINSNHVKSKIINLVETIASSFTEEL